MKIFQSLRWRIQLWHGAFLLAVLLGLGVAAYRFEEANALKRTDDELRKRAAVLFDSIPRREDRRGPPPGGPRGGPPDDRREGPPGPPGHGPPDFVLQPEHAALFDGSFYYVLWRRDGQPWGDSPNAPEDVPVPKPPGPGKLAETERTRGFLRESFAFTPRGDCILVGCSTEPDRRALENFARRLVGIETAILLLGLGGGWWVTSRSLKPLDAITETAADISQGRLDQRIRIRQTDSELGQLAGHLNETFGKLEESFDRQARFTSDAAHELRTPISVIISQAQLALRGEREPAEYREMFEASLRAARRMQKLTQSLLELSRLDADVARLKRVPCDLAALAAEAICLMEIPARERNVGVSRKLSTAPCLADPDPILQILLNLFTNALEHSPADSTITVSAFSSDGHAVVSVADEGPGIAENHLPRLFDRFYRADESRNRETGGTGLGLAICKSIVEAHGGTISVSSEVNKGSVFLFSIPFTGS